MTPGRYALKFEGFAVDDNGDLNRLIGVGYMNLDRQGKITGKHKASAMRMEGTGHAVLKGDYTISGSYTRDRSPQDETTGVATVKFTSPTQTMTDDFAVVLAGGPDRFWFISQKPVLTNSSGGGTVHATELVSGEAVLLYKAP